MKDADSIVAALSYKYEGDFNKIYAVISRKERINADEVDELISKISTKYITIMDEKYPYFFNNRLFYFFTKINYKY